MSVVRETVEGGSNALRDAAPADLAAAARLAVLVRQAALVAAQAAELHEAAKAELTALHARVAAGGADPDDLPDTCHEHRPGRRAILAVNPELRAFVEARFGRITFTAIEKAVADRFGPGVVSKSTIADWHKKNRSRFK